MARPREELQTVLESVLGTREVYFQPPESFKLKYPCIIYELSRIRNRKANNTIYLRNRQYTVTIIDEDCDTELPDKLCDKLEYCQFDRRFITDNLYHDVFTVYF